MSSTPEGSLMSLSFAVRDYENQRNDLAADAIMKELNESLDVNLLLEMRDVEQKQFVLSILKILSLVDSRSELAWSVLNILSEICNSSRNETILNHLQKLTPMVSKLMLVAVKDDKKVCVLNVLQTLTYGIKIPHPDTYVAPLISSLIDCSKPGNESSIIQLSLSVLANLLHRNKAVLLSLMQAVNVKDFMSDLLCVRSNIMCKMEVCKLMFLLEDLIHEKPEKGEVLNFIRVTFCSVMSSGSTKNTPHLQHCVLFFADMVNEKKISVTTLDHPWFFESVQKVIDLLSTGLEKNDLGCAMLLFKFLRIFIKMEIPSFSTFHQAIMTQGIAWTFEHKKKTTDAVITMQCILTSQIKSQSSQGDGMSGDELISVFVSLLKERPTTSSDYNFLTALVDFLGTASEVDLFNIVLKEYLEMETIKSLLEAIPSNLNILSNFNLSEPVVKMYIHLLNFVSKIVTCCNKSWINFYTCLFEDQRVVATLAAALVYGSVELKGRVLLLVGSVGFPGENIELLANSLAECGSGRKPSLTSPMEDTNDLQMSPRVASTYAEVDKSLCHINNLMNSNKLQPISSTPILQLYQYKEQVNSDYQKSLVSSLTRANEERLLLQEEIYLANLITSELRQELYCLRPAFDEMRNKYDSALKAMEEKEQDMSNLKKRLNEETAMCQSQLQKLKENSERQERELVKATSQIEMLKEQLTEKAEALKTLQDEDLALREEHGKLSTKVANLTKELEIMDLELKSKSKQVVALETEKKAKEREIQELQRIRDTVFELTGGRKKF